MAQMNLFKKQKQIHRHREQICGCLGGERERDEIRRAWKAVVRTLNFSFTERFFWPCSKIYLY